MLVLVADAVIQHKVVDDAIAILINFRPINALLNPTASKAWRKVQKSVSTANLKSKFRIFAKISAKFSHRFVIVLAARALLVALTFQIVHRCWQRVSLIISISNNRFAFSEVC